MSRRELLEEFELCQRKKEAALRVQIIAAKQALIIVITIVKMVIC